ncbi:MAG TPA: L-serine ammonia-lyase, iron-sulfur-dependent, subunit alpha [Candidatus Avidesulfovibrio excrementigallinarum]|nr:L-serine ammonia-lyase, iron-sulfur-dependent, subunit alpha [Candidatus Avidesulfovibrio excrementigallinarum]
MTHCPNCGVRSAQSARLLSLFDSLGPIMSGPSSSHTAGMVRIGRMGRAFINGTPDHITLHFFGALSHTYKGHASDSAVVAGLIGEHEDSPNIRHALELARKQGVTVAISTHPDSDRNPNTVSMELSCNGKIRRVAGISVGGGEIEMTELEGFSLCLRGNESGALFIGRNGLSREDFESRLGPLAAFSSVQNKEGRTLYQCLTQNSSPAQNPFPDLEFFPVRPILDNRLADPDPLFATFADMVQQAGDDLPGLIERYEMRRSGVTQASVRAAVQHSWEIMKASVQKGLTEKNDLLAGFLPGDDGIRLARRAEAGLTLSGRVVGLSVARALAVMENNGAMCCVVAAPTAGACGVLPGAFLSVAEERHLSDDAIIDGLLVAAAVGVLIAMRAPISGALGGCQSEIGVASAMTAAGLVQLGGGTPEQTAQAAAIALKNMLGLICDPVAGPVEIPCIKRNAVGVANAFAAADMALAGIASRIPPDQVVDALINVQGLLHPDLRGNLRGGLASTATGKALKDEWYDRMKTM